MDQFESESDYSESESESELGLESEISYDDGIRLLEIYGKHLQRIIPSHANLNSDEITFLKELEKIYDIRDINKNLIILEEAKKLNPSLKIYVIKVDIIQGFIKCCLDDNAKNYYLPANPDLIGHDFMVGVKCPH